jgi:hypothetical protein
MKHQKLLLASIGFIAASALVCLFAIPAFVRNVQEKTTGAYPNWLYAVAWGAVAAGGIWWALKGARGLCVLAFAGEEEKARWEEQFSRAEAQYRGGSRRTVIVLGFIAIIVWLMIALALRST